jgi:hypothetical protein
VTTTLSPPIRVLALVGVLAAAALGILLFMQNRDTASTTQPATPTIRPRAQIQQTTSKRVAQKAHTAKPAHVKAARKVVLLPGLPPSIAHALRYSDVVVVSLFARGAQGDGAARSEARKGARAVHAAFVSVNVLDERTAIRISDFAGENATAPSVLVVKRPGRVVNRFQGFTDRQLVAQAAQNVGAGR